MIEFKTQLDVNAQKALNKMNIKKAVVIFIVLSLFIIGIGVTGIVMAEDSSDVIVGINLIIVGALFTPILLIINEYAQSMVRKTSPFLQNPTKEIYRFTEDGFEHFQKRDESFFSHTKADYTYFYKVISTPKYYFAYIASNQCHVINKAHITQGACEELDAIFARKLPVGKFKKTNR